MSSEATFGRVAEVEASGRPAALVTVVKVVGSTPRAPRAKMIVFEDGTSEGTIGGGRVEQEAIAIAREVLKDGGTRLVELKLTQELGMCCGGQVTLFVEAMSTRPVLVIFGGGHVGRATSLVAALAGFRVHVVDERPELLERITGAVTHHDLLDVAIPLGAESSVLVTTHDHGLDQQLVERVLSREHGWVGLIGSRRKAEMTRARLEAKGFAREVIDALRCPVGLAIGAETPEEIALSIVGELVACRRGARATLETKA